ncbi:trypco2 family protein [Streptomyces hokutonensis]|uniref:trypco2 family protein n=1 Tax=Streptomyces hokutonensis TaxID=1306990 RepID=UPI003820D396
MATNGLAAAIEELRQELYKAQDQGAQQQFAFQIEEAQLELLLELRDEGKGDGKLQFGVATVSAGGSHSSTRTHKLTLKLHWFRRLSIRWEIRDDIHHAFVTLGCAVICWRRLRTALC